VPDGGKGSARPQKADAQLRRSAGSRTWGDTDKAGLPTTEIARGELGAGINVADLLDRARLAASKGEACRLIRGGGARLNDARIDDEALVVDTAHLQGESVRCRPRASAM
jgi:tyrosyl-tRNA synthetase